MNATVSQTPHRRGCLQEFNIRYSDGTSCLTWVPSSLEPELLEDIYNDALALSEPAVDLPPALASVLR